MNLIYFFFILSNVISIEYSGIPNNKSMAIQNSQILSKQLNNLRPFDEFIIPSQTYYIMGGVRVYNIQDVNIINKGKLQFSDDITHWPLSSERKPYPCLYFSNIQNVSFYNGIIDGNGHHWWGISGYWKYREDRPRLFHIQGAKSILIHNMTFQNSPYWTVHIENIDGLVIRYSTIVNRITKKDEHTWKDLTAFNTDGIDVTGKNVHVHDCNIWTQDDCIAVKGESSNMLFERINASGLGLTIGSIGQNKVTNITFRNCEMHNTVKGIYLKFNNNANSWPGGIIQNITYQNITMINPVQYPIWIGPAQQADTINICEANPCSLCWPSLRPFVTCHMPLYGNFSNILLENIFIKTHKKLLTGLFMGSKLFGIQNLQLKNITHENSYGYKYM